MSVRPCQSRRIGGSLLCGLAAAGVALSLALADDPAKPAAPPQGAAAKPPAGGGRLDVELREFMRKKLAASGQILEGLAVDDMDLVKAGARQLHELSTAERWRVTNDALYRQFSGDFREITNQIIKAADEGNADRVAIKWMDATLSCLDCHRYVRGMPLAREGRP